MLEPPGKPVALEPDHRLRNVNAHRSGIETHQRETPENPCDLFAFAIRHVAVGGCHQADQFDQRVHRDRGLDRRLAQRVSQGLEGRIFDFRHGRQNATFRGPPLAVHPKLGYARAMDRIQRTGAAVVLAACLATVLATRSAPIAQRRAPVIAPAVVVLEARPDSDETTVRVRFPGAVTPTMDFARVTHAPGSARVGRVTAVGGALVVYGVFAEREAQGAATYNSALFRVDAAGAHRIIGDVCDASAPLITAAGTVLVQRGRDGLEVPPDPTSRALRERVDALEITAVDPTSGSTRTLWSGEGQIAYLACALRGEEALVYHVTSSGAYLFGLDAATRIVRPILGPFDPLARDFSYDAARDRVVYARASAPRSREYEVVSLDARGASLPTVLLRAESDHLMPRVLADGTVALSLPGDTGLGELAVSLAGARPSALAPASTGAHATLGQSPDGQWLAVRTTTARSETLVIASRASGTRYALDRPDTLTEFAGFLPAGVTP